MRSNVIAGLRSKNRRTFYIVAATAMKRLLIDYARTKNAGKNGGGLSKASVELLDSVPDLTRHDVALRLHNALEQLGEIDPRKHDVVMLRFFGGLKNPEVAETLGVSVSTVEKDWQFAKAFLATEIDDEFLDEEVT
jgi:RNA polymerase sigma factor (TIGR02999 family)